MPPRSREEGPSYNSATKPKIPDTIKPVERSESPTKQIEVEVPVATKTPEISKARSLNRNRSSSIIFSDAQISKKTNTGLEATKMANKKISWLIDSANLIKKEAFTEIVKNMKVCHGQDQFDQE